mmetsp:Transcript_12858/g.24431  ORF Transcript_12858/g.24431 Transcript_12858/m.24431 type:complete len:207 (-) Transcript_12858:814-1434(-)
MPVTCTRSPGLATSTRSSNTQRFTVCGVSPSGISSGVSCILSCWRLANWQRLCSKLMEKPCAHCGLGHLLGSRMRPRSRYCKAVACPHARQRKSAAFRSGSTPLHRVTMPLTLTIWSMSEGFRSRICLLASRLYVRTWMRLGSSSLSCAALMAAASSLMTMSRMGITSCGYCTSWLYSSGSKSARLRQSKLNAISCVSTISCSRAR